MDSGSKNAFESHLNGSQKMNVINIRTFVQGKKAAHLAQLHIRITYQMSVCVCFF